MTHRPNRLALVAGFFSIVPMPAFTEVTAADARGVMRSFAPLGALIGLAAGLVGGLTTWLSGTTLLPAALAIAAGQLLVGAMHLDGLADTVDGLAALGSRKSGRDADRALQIMQQPDTGAMGVSAIVGVLVLQVAALASTSGARELAVLALLAAVSGRLAVLIASRRSVPPARPGGFGALFCQVISGAEAAAHTAVGALLAGALGWWLGGWFAAVTLVIVLLLALGCSVMWTRRLVGVLGGVTGDVFGALIEVTSTIFLVLAALALAVM
ncbi:MAG: adenosylcobinamide-GDP ribazoletransferase [Brooklawnia sp.]|jgi:adenosylcobinamide-GDP ribazoletransferase